MDQVELDWNDKTGILMTYEEGNALLFIIYNTFDQIFQVKDLFYKTPAIKKSFILPDALKYPLYICVLKKCVYCVSLFLPKMQYTFCKQIMEFQPTDNIVIFKNLDFSFFIHYLYFFLLTLSLGEKLEIFQRAVCFLFNSENFI